MILSRLKLHNFRIYKGNTEIFLEGDNSNNINIIAGKNGFGKTTFLLSLVWCLYGKMIGEVEEKYKKDIKNAGGYDNFLKSLLNRDLLTHNKENTELFVELEFSKISIPSLPCNSIVIKRSFNLNTNIENLQILIDGIENELSKEVGYELFINDFLLPREIAKFFFFDAEKIVSLAEANTKPELQDLSRAYSEVLGIKKYEDLKKNLESLITKLKRSNTNDKDSIKLNQLLTEKEDIEKGLEFTAQQEKNIEKEIFVAKIESDDLQEKLIREGNEITLEELIEMKHQRDVLKKESEEIKSQLKKIIDFVPLVISGKKLIDLKSQLEYEFSHYQTILKFENLSNELKSFTKEIISKLEVFNGSKEIKKTILLGLDDFISKKNEEKNTFDESKKILLDFDNETYRTFETIFSNIKNSFSDQFNLIIKKDKDNKILYSRILQKIKQAEARKDNHFVRKIREEKIKIDQKIENLIKNKEAISIDYKNLNLRFDNIKKNISEVEKKVNVAEKDQKKLQVTENLLDKVNKIIYQVKEDKKFALQKSLLLGLNKIMHKDDFISDVEIVIDDEIMDIKLLDAKNNYIDKNSLSKGEQQLYATALLKALVDESGIKFPVFIDSPLQKFDKEHSNNIINEFYPYISEQVVLLPLIEKELSVSEYNSLKSNINKVFIISNHNNNSEIIPIEIEKLFSYKNQIKDVYSN